MARIRYGIGDPDAPPRRSIGRRIGSALKNGVVGFVTSPRLYKTIVVLIFVGGLAGAGIYALSQVGPLTVEGTVTLEGGPFADGEPCAGSGTYADVKAGATVIVTGADGRVPIVGGTLGPGTQVAPTVCQFSFEITDIPRSYAAYGVLVEDSKANILAQVLALTDADLAKPIDLQLP
jgi:hypothetical protein